MFCQKKFKIVEAAWSFMNEHQCNLKIMHHKVLFDILNVLSVIYFSKVWLIGNRLVLKMGI